MLELPYRTTRILKALGNPLRYRILTLLAAESATPTELARALNRPRFVISRNLALLRALDLVWYHPRGPYLVYHAKYAAVQPLLHAAEHCARAARAEDPGAQPDDDGLFTTPQF